MVIQGLQATKKTSRIIAVNATVGMAGRTPTHVCTFCYEFMRKHFHM